MEHNYPGVPVHVIGTSFGGNYLLRYVLKHQRSFIDKMVLLAPPINVLEVVRQMPSIYQWFFVRRYAKETIDKHPEMKFWEDIGLAKLQ